MSKYTGDDGLVKVGTDIVAEVTSFELNGSLTMHDVTAMGHTGKQHLPGKIQDWSGTLNFRHDPDDAGQNALTLGAEITLELYPVGDAEGARRITCAAVIENEPLSIGMDTVSEKAITFKVNGRPTKDVVPATP